MTNEIKHFGVKGMKWRNGAPGVPPQQQVGSAGSQAPRQIPKSPIDPHTIAAEHAIADHNLAMTKTNADLEQIHQKYAQQLKGMAQASPERQKAYNEARQAHVDNMNKAAHKPKPGVPAVKTPPKKYGIVAINHGSWGVHLVNPVKHGMIVTDQAGQVQPSDVLFTFQPHMKHGVPHRIPPIEILHHSATGNQYEDIEDVVLQHHGVKGMKWGVRKEAPTGGGKVASLKKGGVEHPDAKRANDAHKVATGHGTAALSDAEMKKLVERMNMEQQFSNLNKPNTGGAKIKKGRAFTKDLIDTGNTVNSAIAFANSPAGKALKTALKIGVAVA